jgi:hypothetical protein
MSNQKHPVRGRCPAHPSRRIEEGKKRCMRCAKSAKKRAQIRLQRIKSAGVCYKHPDRKVPEGSTRCSECLLDIRLWGLAKKGLPKEELDKAKSAFNNHNGRCEGCNSENPGIRGWCIDHDHDTKTFRGILCTRCNVALGMARDNPFLLYALISYLDGI